MSIHGLGWSALDQGEKRVSEQIADRILDVSLDSYFSASSSTFILPELQNLLSLMNCANV
jgi:hypothetical protein